MKTKSKKILQLESWVRFEVKRLLSEGKKRPKLEGLSVEGAGHVGQDDVGRFFVVTNPTKGSTSENIMFESDVFNLSEKISQGLDVSTIKAIVKKEGAARKVANGFLKERMGAIKSAKNKAQSFKNLKDEVRTKVDSLKTKRQETEQAVQSISEARKNANKRK